MVFSGIQFRDIFRTSPNIFRQDFFGKINCYISDYICDCKKILGCLTEFLIHLWKFMRYYIYCNIIYYYYILSLQCYLEWRHSQALHFMENSFLTRSKTKVTPTKAVTYPRHYFNREVKKVKGSWDKIAHLHIQKNQESSKLWGKLN